MYNMDISILGYKFNLEILILIGVVYLILVGHTLCGCSNFYSLIEGNDTMEQSMDEDTKNKMKEQVKKQLETNMPTQTTSDDSTSNSKMPMREGFVGANTNYGESSAFNLSDTMPVNTSSWSAQNMTVVPGQPLSKGVKQFLARKPQPVPLPEGELSMFANTPFKPECCPNTYSNSMGCACMTGDQYNYLIMRGGNNVPYSEY
jgi:hypothetical protein